MLRECPDIHFAGSCEARDITQGEFDILLAEGFTGNIVLKMYEGVAATLLGVVKEGLMSSLRSKIGALMIKPALKGVLAKFNADVYGGAPLLGLRGLVVKAHGNAKADVISVCIEQCMKYTDQKINAKIENAFAQKED